MHFFQSTVYLYENRRIKDKQIEKRKRNKRKRIYTDLFGLVIVDDDDSDEVLLVSINDRCCNAKRASAAVVADKYGEYHRDGCVLPTLAATW